MNKNLTNYCTSCGEKVEDFSKKCPKCGKHPNGGLNDILTEEESGMSFEQQKYLNNQYCINCGTSVKNLTGNYSKIVCPNCGVNPFGLGKEFREKITINFCENCGKEVKDRDEVCSCGRLPYYYDNIKSDWDMDEIEKLTVEEFEIFLKEDSERESEKEREFEILYCKECGFNHNNESKYDFVNEETGEVYIKCPKCGSGGSI